MTAVVWGRKSLSGGGLRLNLNVGNEKENYALWLPSEYVESPKPLWKGIQINHGLLPVVVAALDEKPPLDTSAPDHDLGHVRRRVRLTFVTSAKHTDSGQSAAWRVCVLSAL